MSQKHRPGYRSPSASRAVGVDRQRVHWYRPWLEILEERLAPTINLSITDPAPFPKGDVGTSMGMFVITRSGDLAPPVQVHYATQDGTAHAGTDYVATSGTLSFAANQTTATIAVPIFGNTLFEPNLTFTVALSNPLALATFSPPQTFATGLAPFATAAGDFTGDGQLDLAVANFASNTVSVLLNQTTPGASPPQFRPPQTFATGSGPRALAIADVNGDGRPDLIVANSGSDTVSVLLNQTPPGATVPTFAPQQTFAAGAGPVSVAVGSLTGDGRPDLIVADVNASSVSVLLNQTAPGATTLTFSPAQTFATQAAPRAVVTGDLNGDGRPDLVVANADADTVSVLLNQTPPGATVLSFSPQQTFAAGSDPTAVAVGDLNGDGRPDLAVADVGSDAVSVLLNQTPPGASTPSFAPQQTFATGTAPVAVGIADVNQDRSPDLVVANEGSSSISVLLNQTAPGATAPSLVAQQTFAAGRMPASVLVGDLNGDGQPDLIETSVYANTLAVLTNQAQATTDTAAFAPAQSLTTRGPALAVADVNGDGRPDLIIANQSAVSVLLNQTAPGATTLSFAPPQTCATGLFPYSVAVGDVNGDGLPDLVVANNGSNTLSVLLNQTMPGATVASFAPQQTFGGVDTPLTVALADLNGDGKPDLVATNFFPGTVSVLLNQTPPGATVASFGPARSFATGGAARSVAVGDLNGDGRPDLAVTSRIPGEVSVLLNRTAPGATTPDFAPKQTFATGFLPYAVALGDFNGDGRPDLAVANQDSGSVSVLLNQTAPGATVPSFTLQQTFPTGRYFSSVAVGDVDGDGRVDLVLAGSSTPNTVSVLLNETGPGAPVASFAPQQTFPAIGPARVVVLADLNGDGRPDVAMSGNNNNVAEVLLNTTNPIAITGSPATGTILDQNAPVSMTEFAGDNQLTTVNTTFGAPLVVEVRNAAGYLVQGVSVTFTVSRGSNGAAAAFNGNATVLTDASGHATAPPLVANTIAGSFTVTAVTTQGSQPLSVTFHLTNTPAAAAALGVSAPPSVTAGTAFSITVTALDPYGNTVPSYIGTVAFFSTDDNATLPANYPFTAGDAGVHTFAGVILRNTGLRFILADDMANDQIGGFAPVLVTAAPASRLLVTGYPSPTTAGVSHPFTVTAEDLYGNVVLDYAGTIHFASSDPRAELPGDYTLTAADNGTHLFTAALRTVGTQSLTATAADLIPGTQADIVVSPPAVAVLAIGLTGLGPDTTDGGVMAAPGITPWDTPSNAAANGDAAAYPAGSGEATRTGNASASDAPVVSGFLSEARSRADSFWAPGSNPPFPPVATVDLDLLSGSGNIQEVAISSGRSTPLPAAPSHLPKSATTG
jgi:hypothetical protein